MANPGGNYPGRQIFLGGLRDGSPAFAYFGSGRSAPSQARYATPFIEAEGAVRIKPVSPHERFDPFRHYQAVLIDPATGLIVVSNSQAPVDAAVEAYTLGSETKGSINFLKRLLAVIGPEYDNREKPTPRIVGVIVSDYDGRPLNILGITTRRGMAHQTVFRPENGTLAFLQTYDGNVEYRSFNQLLLSRGDTLYETSAATAQELADELYETSDYIDERYGELRVWCVAGVRNGRGPGGWEIRRRNRHTTQ